MSGKKSKNRTSKSKVKNNKTRTNVKIQIKNKEKSHIVHTFLEMLNVVKLYHWKTRSFAQHKATDELYDRLNKHIDSFVEVLLGKEQKRIKLIEQEIKLMDPEKTSDFQSKIFEYRSFLTDMNIYFDTTRDTDLLSIRDDILGDINQFLYLMTFDK
jgi:DNA-binding ferritin-like protein